MTLILVRKFMRDVWLQLAVLAVLLCAFQCLWAHVTHDITTQLLPKFSSYVMEYGNKKLPFPLLTPELVKGQSKKVARDLQDMFFEGPGKIIQSLVGGETIGTLDRPMNLMSVGYVHPLVQALLCIWAIGRAAGAISGEIDRGTMELLLAQPVSRGQVVLAHFCVDVLTFPVLCLSLWGGTWLGTWLVGFLDPPDPDLRVDPWAFAPAMLSVALLLFAVSGFTMLLSALGRFRGRVLALAILVVLLEFLINLIGQLLAPLAMLRPFTVFYYYQPQSLILGNPLSAQAWFNFTVLFIAGATGYLLALWTFCRRDLPAPL